MTVTWHLSDGRTDNNCTNEHLGQVDIWFATSADAMLLVCRTSASQISWQPLVCPKQPIPCLLMLWRLEEIIQTSTVLTINRLEPAHMVEGGHCLRKAPTPTHLRHNTWSRHISEVSSSHTKGWLIYVVNLKATRFKEVPMCKKSFSAHVTRLHNETILAMTKDYVVWNNPNGIATPCQDWPYPHPSTYSVTVLSNLVQITWISCKRETNSSQDYNRFIMLPWP